MAAGAVLVGGLAIALDLITAGIQRLVVSPGVTGRYSSAVSRRRTALISQAAEGTAVSPT
jgi:osmoprotectant transport system permease protein